jgi:hypothetical protein
LVQQGHFQIDSVVDDDEKGNIDLVFVCWRIVEIVLTFDLSMIEGTTNWTNSRKIIEENNLPASARHFSGYFLAYSSWARANFGHENGVTLPSTFK